MRLHPLLAVLVSRLPVSARHPGVLLVAFAAAAYLAAPAPDRPEPGQAETGVIESVDVERPELATAAPAPLLLTQAGGFESCPQFFIQGAAPVLNTHATWLPRALCFSNFAVLHSGVTRTPLLVAERLSRQSLLDAAGEERTNRFYADARLPKSERAELSDYDRSGFDRGHLAAAANQPDSESMAQSFSLANMVPQAPVNNRKTWKKLEIDTRQYAKRAKGVVYVVSGPAFRPGAPRRIGRNGVFVPDYLWKLVHDQDSGRTWVHWLQNTNDARAGRPISYDEFVRRTGLRLLP